MNLKKMNSRIFNKGREGITLLFVISMVVLFLLMGTTFMIVSNDFYKAARLRARRSTNVVNPAALLDRCFYDLFRGPDLADVESPLRGHSILADQYGYGIIARLEQVFREAPSGVGTPLAQLRLSIDDMFTRRQFAVAGLPDNPFSPTAPVNERFFAGKLNGQVISIVGGNFDGYTGRILSSRYDDPANPDQVIIHVVIDGALNPTQTTPTSEADKRLQVMALRTTPALADGVFGSAVVINGRDFSGVGAGNLAVNPYQATGGTSPGILTDGFGFDVDSPGGAGAINYLGNEALRPNRFGESLAELTGNPDDYLPRLNSPNEPYDAADFQNMFLSATLDAAGMIVIPSFHRDSLYTDQVSTGASARAIQDVSFRAVRSNMGSEANTANSDFPHLTAFAANGTLGRPVNAASSLDVDSDNDGILDAVWIDIGLPSQTDPEGRTFKPLVAYRVVDLDNRLNLNAHGNIVDAARTAAPTVALGGGYDVAEISLRVAGVTESTATPALYANLLSERYGDGNLPGHTDAMGATAANALGRNQKLFSYPENPAQVGAAFGNSFNTAFDLLGEYTVASDVRGLNNQLPGYSPINAPFTTTPYNTSFSLAGAAGDELFTAVELEGLLRPNDADSKLISSRLDSVVSNFERLPVGRRLEQSSLFTTHSFEVNMPATGRSLPERINDLLPMSIAEPMRSQLINELTPREVIFGGKLNINRYLGNGLDDNSNGVVDEPGEVNRQMTRQSRGPAFATNSRRVIGSNTVRNSLVRDLYISFLLACGDTPPASFTHTGSSGDINTEYHRMVAQWAVNVVDFRDADSINTGFRFDPTPFDGMPFDTTNADFMVWGCERPEILISETFAFHDRQNRDTSVGGETTDPTPDPDWDSFMQPVAGAVIEFFNPWNTPMDFQRPSQEVGNAVGVVNLSALTPGDDPVWRVALKRNRTISNRNGSDVLRTIFFVEPSNVQVQSNSDAFFPVGGSLVLGPGEYGALKPVAGNDVTVGLETLAGIGRSLFINGSRDSAGTPIPGRVMNISDPAGGYAAATYPLDSPVDSVVQTGRKSNRIRRDLNRLWVNGIADNYRYVFLQRLADPTRDWNANNNPYLTVDTAGIDLLGMNTTAPMYTRDNGNPMGENGGMFTARDRATRYHSVERGETLATTSVEQARQNLFYVDDGPNVSADDLVAGFEHTFGMPNDSYDDSSVTPVSNRTPFGWLAWNNRPFASHMELLNVPYTPQAMLTFVASNSTISGTSFFDTFKTEVADVVGNNTYEHLFNFSTDLAGGANRFANIFEFVETPSLFLGTETFLSGNTGLINNSLNLVGDALGEFTPRVHGIPQFRRPGKININTISPLQAQVWANLTAGFPTLFSNFINQRQGGTGGSDFGSLFTTTENASFVPSNARVGAASTLNSDGSGTSSPAFDAIGQTGIPELKKDPAGSSYFAHEFRQKMGNMVTTRSSVFAIWITVGYFEVDEFGLLGAEIADEEGDVNRNRGFYIVDRSIPVAFEPGKNHNVDRAVLVRSIIE